MANSKITADQIATFLTNHQPVAEEPADWGAIQLTIWTYLSRAQPPRALITSARSVAIRAKEILVMQNRDGTHILPGGRIEAGETPEAALRRELLEEAGVTLGAIEPIGFMHLRHTTPKPQDYSYLYPDFFWTIYKATAVEQRLEARMESDYEFAATFRPDEEVRGLDLAPSQRAYLDATRP